MSNTKYTITSITEDETSNGNEMKRLGLSNGDSVNLFENHDRYHTLSENDKISQDELYVNKSGYVDLKDQPGDSIPDSAEPYEGKTNEMDQAMTRKEQGIKMSSTARMAADMVVAEVKAGHVGESKLEKKDRWREWRSFFSGNWEAMDEEFTNPDDVIQD